MNLIKCGTKAKFSDIEGIICGIEITYTNVVYKFGYLDKDLNYKTLWAHQDELILETKQRQKIGFATSPKL